MTRALRALREKALPSDRRPVPAGSRAATRVVAVGGGTGLPAVLGGLARLGPREPVSLTALVATCDDGGSSGALRRRYGLPSPGDVRNCLVALAPEASRLAGVFQHRFPGRGGPAGHTVGNLVLTALTQQLGDFHAAVTAAGRMLGARGRVLPSTEAGVELVAALADGRIVRGETAIAAAGSRVIRLKLERPVAASRPALEAIAGADLVVLGPGSLYTSVIASVLAEGVSDALRSCRATRVLVVNLFTQPETDGYDAADHVRALQEHLGPVVDVALVHEGPWPARLLSAYAARGARPVAWDRGALAALGVAPRAADVLAPGEKARHDAGRLGRVLLELAGAARSRARR